MKLKLDDQGHVVVVDGNPVYTHDDGKDVPFDAKASVAKITSLNGEAMRHRQDKEKLELDLKRFEGVEDPEAAKKALETVKNLDAGQMKTAAQVEEIKEQARKAAEAQVAEAARQNGVRTKELETKLESVTKDYDNEKITNAFSTSKFLQDKVSWPPDALQAIFGGRFKREDGKLVGYDASGNKIFSRTRHGEVADFDEAIEMTIDGYAHKDSMLKGTQSSGTGGRQSTGNGAGGKTISRAQFDAMSPVDQGNLMREGKSTVVD